MSLPLTGTGGIFTVFGPAFRAMDVVNTALGTTVPPFTKAFQDAYQAGYAAMGDGSQPYEIAMQAVPQGEIAWQSSGSSYTTSIINALSLLLVEYVRDDTDITGQDFDFAIRYLVADMVSQSATVDDNAVSSTGISAGSGNGDTDVSLLYTLLDGDGKSLENAYDELLRFVVSTAGRYPQFTVAGDEPASSATAFDWPIGSGVLIGLTASDASVANYVPNPNFEENTDGMPTRWFATVGDSTSVLTTSTPVHQVVIASDPTAGSYLLKFTNPYDDRETYTDPIPWNATAAQVQAALGVIDDLGSVSVSATGTSPNFTHTITMTDVGRAPSVLVAVNQLDTGTVTPSVITSGDQYAYQGKALYLLGDGAELTEIRTELGILGLNSTYFLAARMAVNATVAAGVIRFQVLDALGAVVQDGEGNSATLSVTATTLPSDGTFYSLSMSFRASLTSVQPFYLQVKLTTAVTTAGRIYIDNLNIVDGVQLYSGGPSMVLIGGLDPTTTEDTWTLPITNDYGGQFQTWFGRAFDMASYGLVLPSAGSPTIPDSLIGP